MSPDTALRTRAAARLGHAPEGAVEATNYTTIAACRSCRSNRLEQVVDFGRTPAADALVDPADGAEEASYPLDVVFCADCSLVQLRHTVDPEVLFGADYPYYSSFSDDLAAHSRDNAHRLVDFRGLAEDSLVVEIASNDGYLLRHFVARGVPVLGVDPAPGPAAAAVAAGVPTEQMFFSSQAAARLVTERGHADVVIANNVLAHVADLNGFVRGLATLVAPDGVISIEVPSVRRLVEQTAFDTIYHEHLCYFSVSSLVPLFRRHGLRLIDVEELWIHGGSLRLTVAPEDGPDVPCDRYLTESVRRAIDEESDVGVTTHAYYRAFARRVSLRARSLAAALLRLRLEGHRLAAYGAAAKGATLLNVAGVDRTIIDFVVDRNVHKQGRSMPGSRIPIRAPEALLQERPGVCVLLAWNFEREIVAQQRDYLAGGGRFLVPVPSPRFVAA